MLWKNPDFVSQKKKKTDDKRIFSSYAWKNGLE